MKLLDNIRIIKNGELYFVEQQITQYIIFKKWIPFCTWSGLAEGFGFSSFDSALDAALLKLKWHLIDKRND